MIAKLMSSTPRRRASVSLPCPLLRPEKLQGDQSYAGTEHPVRRLVPQGPQGRGRATRPGDAPQ
jgi:hypothetical protein